MLQRVQSRLRVENDRLREENAHLHTQEVLLRAESSSLERTDDALHEQTAALRQEGARLRGLVANYASSLAAARRGHDANLPKSHLLHHNSVVSTLLGLSSARGAMQQGLNRGATIGLTVLSVLLLAFYAYFFTYGAGSGEDDEDSESDDEGSKLRSLISQDHHRRYGMCWCCCNHGIARFFAGVFVFSILGGIVLWKFGILQPILSQCIMYVYVALIVGGFVSLIISQLWNLLRRLVVFIMTEFQKLTSVFRVFGKRSKYKWHDFMDDGQLASSYKMPDNRGRRPRERLAERTRGLGASRSGRSSRGAHDDGAHRSCVQS